MCEGRNATKLMEDQACTTLIGAMKYQLDWGETLPSNQVKFDPQNISNKVKKSMEVFAAHVAPCRLWLGLLARLSLFERGSSKLV